MDSFNFDPNYYDHIKTKRLVKGLGKGADSLPIRLWCYTAKHYGADGVLIGHTAGDIEAAVDWWGEEGQCVEAFLSLRFLEKHGDTFVVHGWVERNGHIGAFAIRAKKAAEARWARYRGEMDATRNAQASPSNALTIPTNLTNQTKLTTPKPPRGFSAAFDAFWLAYPRTGRARTSKGKTWKVWNRNGLDSQADVVISGLARWKASEHWTVNDGAYVKNPATFLSDEYFLSPPEPEQGNGSELIANPGPKTREEIAAVWGSDD